MQSSATIAGLIVLTSFVSEDAAALAAASLASQMSLDVRLAFAAAAGGIWIGDLGLYFLGIPLRALAQRWKTAARWLARAEDYVQQERAPSSMAIFASRFIPGTRLPLYTAAGLTRLPFLRFATISGVAVLAWVALLFFATNYVVGIARAISGSSLTSVISAAVAIIGIVALVKTFTRKSTAFQRFLRKYSHWEFWPAWLFYAPVALMCVRHGVRYRGFSLPTAANPGQKNGGIVGESKYELLSTISDVAPHATPAWALINHPSLPERLKQFNAAMECLELSYPVVLKPDVAQRGLGFKKIGNARQAYQYLSQVCAPVILQQYVAAEHEIGIFYYRFPNESTGRIFSITEKEFPFVMGDGVSTLRELIEGDDRAALIAGTYLRRFKDKASEIVPAGKRARLVEAGNHAQGCVFKDGMHLWSAELEQSIDVIAKQIPGFHIGRFDVRYSSADELRRGEGYQILELNGAASEATNIYDSNTSLLSAYRTLYRQWRLVYAIGAANRAAGHDCTNPVSVIADWVRFCQVSSCYPEAD